MTFYINKRRRKTPYMVFSMQIRLFKCLSEGVGCRQYVLNFKLFWIWSEGVGRNFSIISEIQNFLNYPRGGGSSLIGNFSQIFPFFFSDGSPSQDALYKMHFTVCMSWHSSGSLEGVHPSSAEVIKDTEEFVYYSGF